MSGPGEGACFGEAGGGLAQSIRDAKDIADELAEQEMTLRLESSAHDPPDPMDNMMFNMLATFAEFEAELIRMHTREGMQVAKAKGKL